MKVGFFLTLCVIVLVISPFDEFDYGVLTGSLLLGINFILAGKAK